jgi:hypothetical protein
LFKHTGLKVYRTNAIIARLFGLKIMKKREERTEKGIKVTFLSFSAERIGIVSNSGEAVGDGKGMMIGDSCLFGGISLSGTRFVPRIEKEMNKRMEGENAGRKTGEEKSNESCIL